MASKMCTKSTFVTTTEEKLVDSYVMSAAFKKFEVALEKARRAMFFNHIPKYHNPEDVEKYLKNVSKEMNTLLSLVAKRESEAEKRKTSNLYLSLETNKQAAINMEQKIIRFYTVYKHLIAALPSNNEDSEKKDDDIMRQQWERKQSNTYYIFSRGRCVSQQEDTREFKEWDKVTPISKWQSMLDPIVPEPTSTVCHRSISVKAMITPSKFKYMALTQGSKQKIR